MENFEQKKEYKNPIDMILDPDCNEDIVLYDDEDKETVFSQEAVIPLNDLVYVIMTPVTPIDGVGEDEGMVFVIEEEDGEDVLTVVTDENTVNEVFDIYFELCEEEGEDAAE